MKIYKLAKIVHICKQADPLLEEVLGVWGLGFGVWGLGFGVWVQEPGVFRQTCNSKCSQSQLAALRRIPTSPRITR